MAKRFAAEGAKLILVARTSGGLEEVDDAIRAECGEDAVGHSLRAEGPGLIALSSHFSTFAMISRGGSMNLQNSKN